TQDFSKPLWIGVKIVGGQELKPLTQLIGSPFSISIPDSSVTQDKMAVDYVGSISVNGKQITGKGTILNLIDGPGTSLLYDETTNSLSFSNGGKGNTDGGKGGSATVQGIGNSPACYQSDPWVTLLNSPNPDNEFGTCNKTDVLMETNSTIQMTMIGNPVGTPAISGGLLIPASAASGIGVIFQGSTTQTYIHSFNDPTNFFAGIQAGNLTMSSSSVQNTGIGYQALASITANAFMNTGTG